MMFHPLAGISAISALSAIRNFSVSSAFLRRSPSTKANRVQYPTGSPDLRKCESCRTMPLVGGFSRGLLQPPPFHSGAAPSSPQSFSSALKTSLLKAAEISSLTLHSLCCVAHAENDVASIEQRRNAKAGKTGVPRKKINSPTNGIVRHDSRTRNSGSDPVRESNPVRLGGDLHYIFTHHSEVKATPPQGFRPLRQKPHTAGASSSEVPLRVPLGNVWACRSPLSSACDSSAPANKESPSARGSQSDTKDSSELSVQPIRERVSTEQRRNARTWKTGDNRENPLSRGIVRHDSHMRKSGSDPTGNRARFAQMGGDYSNHYTTAATQ
ncbi:hypothetical protein PR048_028866 [Dryococelus australis]|uniref:Uncharacterized protein n=1 Tax=Dryococelus australis TaxID=614101 RepID=A0ABQ9GBR6_9NEOP|nr:hypothetical protein PR048_028866 [Dryococelus australis]